MKIGDKITHEGIEAEFVNERQLGKCWGCCFFPHEHTCPMMDEEPMCNDGIFKQIIKKDETN